MKYETGIHREKDLEIPSDHGRMITGISCLKKSYMDIGNSFTSAFISQISSVIRWLA